MTTTKTRPHCAGLRVPTTGKPRRGGKLDYFIEARDTRNHPIFEGELVYVSVEDQHPRRAVLARADFMRITSRDPEGPRLTKTRWWLDENNMLRAYSVHEAPMTHGVLVAAAVMGAKAGDQLELPADPLNVHWSQIKHTARPEKRA